VWRVAEHRSEGEIHALGYLERTVSTKVPRAVVYIAPGSPRLKSLVPRSITTASGLTTKSHVGGAEYPSVFA
jgi:hypothetical protein